MALVNYRYTDCYQDAHNKEHEHKGGDVHECVSFPMFFDWVPPVENDRTVTPRGEGGKDGYGGTIYHCPALVRDPKDHGRNRNRAPSSFKANV